MKVRTLLSLLVVLLTASFAFGQVALQWNLQEGTGLAVSDELGNMDGALTDLTHASWQAYPSGENGILFDNMEPEKTILVSNDLVIFGQQFTFEGWVKVNEIDTSKHSSIMYLEKKIWNAPKKEQMRGGIKVFRGSNDDHVGVEAFLGFGYDDGTDGGAIEWVNIDTEDELEIGVWAHLALVRDGNYVALCINGYDVGGATQAHVPENQSQVGWVVLGCNKDMDGGTTNLEFARTAVTARALNSDNFILPPVVPDFNMTVSSLQWNLQEGSGLTVADELGNADAAGALTDMAHAGWQAYPSGEYGILFDNLETEKSILASDSLLTFGQQFTYEGWVKVNEIDTSRGNHTVMYIERKAWNAPRKEQMRAGIQVDPGSDIDHLAVKSFFGMGYDDGSDGGAMEWVDIMGSEELEVGVWAHLALVRDGNYVTLYMNGYDIGSVSQSLVPEDQSQLGYVVLGCNKDMDGGNLNVEIARTAVTARALNSDNFILPPVVPDFDMTVSSLQWKLQEGSGLTVADELGNMDGALTDMAHAVWQVHSSGENGILFDNMEPEKTILVSDSLVTFGQQFTFEGWVKVNEIDTSKHSSIMYLEKKIWNAPKKEQMRGGIKVFRGSNDDHVGVEAFLGFGYDDGTDGGAIEWVNIDTEDELELGVWAHLALVRDGNYVTMWINGYAVGYAEQTLVPENQSQVGWVVLGCNKDMDGGTSNLEFARTAVTARALNDNNFILSPVVPDFDPPCDIETLDNGIPNEYALLQNYPNPFNPTTTIQYEIPMATNVRLLIYNIKGQLVKVLVDNQSHVPGNYSVVWDGTNNAGNQVSTGLYIYELRCSDFRVSKRMLLTR